MYKKSNATKLLIFEGSLRPPTFISTLVQTLPPQDLLCYYAGYGKISSKNSKRKNKLIIVSLGVSNNIISQLSMTLLLLFKIILFHPKTLFNSLYATITNSDSINTKLKKINLNLLITLLQPNIIHIQWASHIDLFRSFLDNPIDQRPKVIVSLRGRLINASPYADPSLAKLYRDYFPKVDGFHAVSHAIAKQVQQWGAPSQNIRVIYSGLESEKIMHHHKLDWSINAPASILLIGRFHWIKGYHYALDALRLLLDKGHQIHFTIVAGQATEEIVFQVNSLGLKSNISILPNLPHEEVFSHMQSADILLLPSVAEGIANVVLEAMAVGLPVVSSDCGGMAEVIEHEVHGLLFQNRNVAHMAEQLEKMINYSPEDRERMAMLARQRVTEQFGADRLGKEMVAFYEEVCKKN